MSQDFDLVIVDGTVVDGDGGEPRRADVGIKNGRIAEIGRLAGRGTSRIDAAGCLVTPGFIDIHTHYDGQITWENRLTASSAHGVTTVITGNCGVGFAPCRAADRERLLSVMEGVEDVPEVVMSTGIPWNWETFPEYLDSLERRQFDVDVGVQLPHSALRVYAMGERGAQREAATDGDKARMSALAFDAASAGAMGFATSRNPIHATKDGDPIPSFRALESELQAIAEGFKAADRGVLQVLPSFDDFDAEFAMFKRLVANSGRPLSFSMVQMSSHPELWRRALDLSAAANAEGLRINAQVIGRPTGILLGLDLSYNPFSFCPTYRKIADLPLELRLAVMRQPDFKRRLLADVPDKPHLPGLAAIRMFEAMFPLGDPPNYEPAREHSVAARAEAAGLRPDEFAYDLLVHGDGQTILFITMANYVDGSLDASLQMIGHPNAILGLGDGGAHYGLLCDSSYPSFMLTFWCRDRAGPKLSVAQIVKSLTAVPARAVGLLDRGRIAPGLKADLNVIDFAKLRLHSPRAHYDLPAGGRRVMQDVDGFRATLVGGVVTRRDGAATDQLPGRLIRAA